MSRNCVYILQQTRRRLYPVSTAGVALRTVYRSLVQNVMQVYGDTCVVCLQCNMKASVAARRKAAAIRAAFVSPFAKVNLCVRLAAKAIYRVQSYVMHL